MKTYIALDELAKKSIPEGVHQLLRINSREAWVSIVIDLIIKDKVEPTASNIKSLLKNWESLLITKYSGLN